MLVFGAGYAQKIAYVDTQYILKQIPQFQNSEQRLDAEVKKWKDDIVAQKSKIEKLRISFENEKILLTEDQQKNRLATIDSTEKVLNEFIDKKFGTNGESIALRYNLAKPMQDQIWNAINTVATKDRYNIILDKSSNLTMVFTDSKYDITDKVLKQLGINDKNAEKKEKTNSKETKETKSKIREINNSNLEEEATDNKAKTGFGKRYKSKKEIKNPEVTKDEQSPSEINEIITPSEEIAKPKTGYGSKYVPKKEEKAQEIKEEINTKKKEEKAEEIKKTEKETKESSTGYGRKYVPKKERKTQEIKEEENIINKEEKGEEVKKTKEKPARSKSIPKNKKTEIKKEVNTKNKEGKAEGVKKTEKDAKENSAENKSAPKNKKVEIIKEENKTSSEIDKETNASETLKPKTGYGSKYIPKKKTENNK